MNQNPQPGTHPDADELSLFAEGAATAREREQMLAHLAGCAECREVVFVMQGAAETEVPAATSVRRVWRWQRPLLPVGLAGAALAFGLTALVVYLRIESGPHERAQQIAKEQKTEPESHGNTAILQSNSVQQQPLLAQPLKSQSRTESFAQLDASPHAVRQAMSPGALKAPNAVNRPTAVAGAMGFGTGSGTGLGEGMAASNQPVEAAARPVPTPAPAAPPAASPGQATMPLVAKNLQPLDAQAGAQKPAPQANFAEKANLSVLHIEAGKFNDTLSGISGRVTDPSGALVAKATVTLRNAIGNTRQATTGVDGSFLVTGVAEGHYDLTVSAPGFQINRQSIDLKRGELAMLQPVLKLGSVAETVTVTSNAPLFETDSESVGQISAELPSRLPAIVTASLGKRILSLDSAGSLFLSRNAGKVWKKVHPRWSGKAVRIAVAPATAGKDSVKDRSINGASGNGASDEASLGSASVQRTFQLVTDAGAVWTSEDGKHWRQQ